MPFVYEQGLACDYICESTYPANLDAAVRAEMMTWIRSMSAQSRQRIGKVGIMQGSDVDLKRMEHE